MDDKDSYGARNWDFSGHCTSTEPVLRSISDSTFSQDVSQHRAAFRNMREYHGKNSLIPESESEMLSMKFTWVPQRNFLSTTSSSLGSPQPTQVHPGMSSMNHVPASTSDAPQSCLVEAKHKKSNKKHKTVKKTDQIPAVIPRPSQTKKQSLAPKKKKGHSTSPGIREKKNLNVVYEGVEFDFSSVPAPICSCTGIPRQCYRWGAGGWQSSCCTTTISEYPLPMSTTRPGARIAGRKMSIGAYGKLLQRLATEGQDLASAVDLKNHWARHGTNKFVTIR